MKVVKANFSGFFKNTPFICQLGLVNPTFGDKLILEASFLGKVALFSL